MNKKITLIFAICCSIFLNAQENETVKSLLKNLSHEKVDSSIISIDLKLGWLYYPKKMDSSFFYYNKA